MGVRNEGRNDAVRPHQVQGMSGGAWTILGFFAACIVFGPILMGAGGILAYLVRMTGEITVEQVVAGPGGAWAEIRSIDYGAFHGGPKTVTVHFGDKWEEVYRCEYSESLTVEWDEGGVGIRSCNKQEGRTKALMFDGARIQVTIASQ